MWNACFQFRCASLDGGLSYTLHHCCDHSHLTLLPTTVSDEAKEAGILPGCLTSIERSTFAQNKFQMCGGDRPKSLSTRSLIVVPVNSGKEDGREVVKHCLFVGHKGKEATNTPDGKAFLAALTRVEGELSNKSLAEPQCPVFHLNCSSRISC